MLLCDYNKTPHYDSSRSHRSGQFPGFSVTSTSPWMLSVLPLVSLTWLLLV